jgi:hypothetical protein
MHAVSQFSLNDIIYIALSDLSDARIAKVDTQSGTLVASNSGERSVINDADGFADSEDVPAQWCAICRQAKPIRAKHCLICKRCVLKFDHHCPYFQCCIGERNHGYFIVAALGHSALAVYVERACLLACL